jgi:RNA polymerase primary sigma factor
MREFKISERITMRTSGIDRYLAEISKIPMLTADEEGEVAKKAATGDAGAIDTLIKSNLRFVVSVAKMYHGGSDRKFEDLINEGNIGVIEAASLFDPSTGFKFISFAIWHIRKYMLKYLTENSRTIRLPQNKVVSINQMKHIESDLTATLQRSPTREEVMDVYIANVLAEKGHKTKPEDLVLAMTSDSGVAALERPFNKGGDEDSYSPIDVINGDENGSDHLALDNSAAKLLLPFLERLNFIDREILLMRHGFKTEGESMGFHEIGTRLGYTAERIRQRYKKSIRVLSRRMRLEKMSIDQFL